MQLWSLILANLVYFKNLPDRYGQKSVKKSEKLLKVLCFHIFIRLLMVLEVTNLDYSLDQHHKQVCKKSELPDFMQGLRCIRLLDYYTFGNFFSHFVMYSLQISL